MNKPRNKHRNNPHERTDGARIIYSEEDRVLIDREQAFEWFGNEETDGGASLQVVQPFRVKKTESKGSDV